MKPSASFRTSFSKVIVVTGTPGTGKTTLAKKCAKECGFTYSDVNNLIKTHHLYSSYERKRKSYVVDLKKLNSFLIFHIKKSKKQLVLDSHLAHHLPQKYVAVCLVTHCSLQTLTKRLKKRGYTAAKVEENCQAEIFDICGIESCEFGHRIINVTMDSQTKVSDVHKLCQKIKKFI